MTTNRQPIRRGTGTYLDRLDNGVRIDPWVDVDGALGITPGEKPDVESLPLDESLPVSDVLPTNHTEEHGLVVEEVRGLGHRPKALVLGTPVPYEEHREAYHRKSYPGVIERTEEKAVPPPLVPCRDATAAEIPPEAARAAEAIRARGLPVRVTFAQAGTWRRWKDRGECVTCGATPMVMAEDKRDLESGAVLQKHNAPRAPRCPGGGTAWQGGGIVCATCGRPPKKVNKSGTVPPHDVPLVECPDQRAARMIPGDPRPPVTSIAVRAPHVGVAVWMTEPVNKIDGEDGYTGTFDLAYVVHGKYLVKSSAAEFQAACRGENA